MQGVERVDSPLSVADLHVDVRIKDREAHVRIDQTILNSGPTPVAASNLWPVPPNIGIRNFQYLADGVPVRAERVAGEAADVIYRTAAEQGDNPRILAYLGRPFYRGTIGSVPARGRLQMRMEFDADLPVVQDVVKFHHPLSTNSFSSLPINRTRLTVSLRTGEPVPFFYSPTHAFQWKRVSPNEVQGEYTEARSRPDKDLLLFFGTSRSELDIRVLGYRPAGAEGTFLASIRPGPAMLAAPPVPRDLVFVLDKSGSMKDGKLEQAKAGLEYSLSRLNPEDRFGLIWYDNEATEWRPKLVSASPENLEAASSAVRELRPGSGTNPHASLRQGLELLGKGDRPAAVIFLTDGLPTVGVTDMGQIHEAVRKHNIRQARLLVFGVGYDVNVPFLDRLASQNRGDAEYIRPGDNLQIRMAEFYQKRSQPLLSDLRMTIDGIGMRDALPSELSDLFPSTDLLVVGRYAGACPAEVRVTGRQGGRVRTFTARVPLSDPGAEFAFVPRIWAQRKVGALQDQVRLQGPKPALVEEITRLGREFGIITPYTQALLDDRVSLGLGSQSRALNGNAVRANGFVQGAFATSQSVNNRGLVQNGQVYDNAFFGEDGRFVRVGGARVAAGRALFYRSGFWTEGSWPEDAAPERIKRFSPAYWELLRRHPELTEAFVSGPRVRLLVDGKPVEISDDGRTVAPDTSRAPVNSPEQRSSVPAVLVLVALMAFALVARCRHMGGM